MIITVKNLQQQTFTVDFDAEKTVLQLKEQIYHERGSEYVVEKQKLIYAGVILEDELTIASYNIDVKKFIVVLIKRDCGDVLKPDEGGATSRSLDDGRSATHAEEGSVTSRSEGAVPSTHQFVTEAVGKKSEARNTADDDAESSGSSSGGCSILGTVGSGTSLQSFSSGSSMLSGESRSTYSSGDLAGVFSNTSLQSRAEGNLLMGDEYTRSVDSMIEMGYSREMVERAMAASFNNPERAVEYLISGIPETTEGFNAPIGCVNALSAEAIAQNPQNNELPDNIDIASNIEVPPNSSDPDRADPFDFIRTQPEFLQMRSLVYTNPDLLHAVLQQIGRTNPALLQLITEHQDAFLSMLNRPIEGEIRGENVYPRRMTPGRRALLAAQARASAGGDGAHVRPLDTLPGAGGDGPTPHGGSGDAGDNTDPQQLEIDQQRAAQRRSEIANAFMMERAAAAAAVAALTAAASAAVERDSNAGGDTGPSGTGVVKTDTGDAEGAGGDCRIDVTEDGGSNTRAGDNTCAGDNIGTGDNIGVSGTNTGVLVQEGVIRDDSLPPIAYGIEDDGALTIRWTPEEEDAIERLKALGFPEAAVIQAYFACDKDEQLAADLLVRDFFDD